MSFQYTVEDLSTDTDDETTESFTFDLKDVGDVPVGILRRNRRNQEGLMWDTFEWGLPEDQLDAFDRLTAEQVVEMLHAWQKSGDPEKVDQDKPVGPPKTKKVTKPSEPDSE